MKEITAIIRPEKWQATREAMYALGIEDVTHFYVKGRGKQMGLRRSNKPAGSSGADVPFLPKRLVISVVADEKVAELVESIIKVNQTGNVGDGKIFVRPLEGASAIGSTKSAQAEMATR